MKDIDKATGKDLDDYAELMGLTRWGAATAAPNTVEVSEEEAARRKAMDIYLKMGVIDQAEHARIVFGEPVKAARVGDIDKRLSRQAAKQFNFGHQPSVPPIEGLTPDYIFELFQMMQREDPRAFHVVDGKSVPILTMTQMEVARRMWAGRVQYKNYKAGLADESARPSVRCQGDHTDDLENL